VMKKTNLDASFLQHHKQARIKQAQD